MEKRKKFWQTWCVKRTRLLLSGLCLLFLCVYGILFCLYQREQQRQRMRLVGSVYLQEKDVARVLLNHMMREGDGVFTRRETEKAAAKAIQDFGYTGEAFMLSGCQGMIFFVGGMTGLALLYLVGNI